MSKQNIYDNKVFFEGYYKLRANMESLNNIEEKPTIFAMISDVKGKSIIDLGCGYGENCKVFSDMGATRIVGIDISEKMLEMAKKENSADNIEYHHICMEEVSAIRRKFDIAVSSLAIHYVKDFKKLANDIFSLLNQGGIFVFSQEHPFTTAPIAGARWIKEGNGNGEHYPLTDYSRNGERIVSWIDNDVVKYHRTFSDIINDLLSVGFSMEEMREPIPSDQIIQRLPQYAKSLHKPNFLIIKARK